VSPLSIRILDACLRRVRSPQWQDHELVLVRAHPALRALPAVGDLVGARWSIAAVRGELSLRDALPEAGRLVAVVPDGFSPPPDIAGRAWLHKALDVRADDVVAGITGRPCEPLPDEELAAAVEAAIDLLEHQVGRWSQYGTVTAAEVRAVLVAADLGTDDRFDRERDHDLLRRWIVQGAPQSRIPGLLARALEDSIPRTGRWLAWAARTGDVPGLLAAGAVGPDAEGSWGLEPSPRTAAERGELRALVDRAVRDAWIDDPQRTAAALQVAERRAHQLRAVEEDPGRFPLVKAALDRALYRFARAAAEGAPADDATIDRLRANLYAAKAADAVEHVKDLSRIARALRQAPPAAGVEAWASFGAATVAWLDLAVRGVRRRLEGVPDDLRAPSAQLLGAALRCRDLWNRSFAEALAEGWAVAAASKDLRRALPLHQVSRALITRLIDVGERVLLIVLDGCDLSTFIELMQAWPDGVGLSLPPIRDSRLLDDLAPGGPLRVALAPLPTVTSHARRALFAGEIPGNTALDDTEAPAANASGDAAAFNRNQSLRDAARLLLLKGQLTDGAVESALDRDDLQVLAVVWNGVDDALSSKETTALGPWTPAALGVRAEQAVERALRRGWTVLVTADHGHTPHWDPSRKVAPAATGARYDTGPLPGAVRFDQGPLPARPLHLLTDVGAWAGGQRRGYHGGAALEEVLVPLAFLGRGGLRPRPPGWWWSLDGVVLELEPAPAPAPSPHPRGEALPTPHPRGEALPAPSPAGPAGVPEQVRLALAADPRARAAVEALASHQVLSLSQLARLLGSPPFIVGGLMNKVQRELAAAGLGLPFEDLQTDTERTFRWRRS
jgi:hypothetical protein